MSARPDGLTASRAHDVRIDHYEKSGAASVAFSWRGPHFDQQVVPAAQLLAQ